MKRHHLYAVAGIVLLTILLTYEEAIAFTWKYIAGPLVTHATGSQATFNGVVAEEGYNIYNTALYAISLVGFIAAFNRVLDRWNIDDAQTFVVSVVPFVVMGGLLRVVEDVGMVGYPFNMLLITPIIYFFVAGIAFCCLLVSMSLADKGLFESYKVPFRRLGIFGSVLAVLLLLPAGLHGFEQGTALPQGIFAVVMITVVAVSLGVGLARYLASNVPDTFLNTTVGQIAVIAQVMDGAVTAESIHLLGYGEKHIVSQYIITMAGTPYAFLLVKTAVIVGMLGYLPKENDRFSMLIMLGVIAVGLGPAIRNLTRALLGI